MCVGVCVYLCLMPFGCVAPFPAVSHSIWQLVARFSNIQDTQDGAIVGCVPQAACSH